MNNYPDNSNNNNNSNPYQPGSYFRNPDPQNDPYHVPVQEQPNNAMGVIGNQNQMLNQGQYYGDQSNKDGNLYANSRIGFIRKVYTLLTLQLLVTAGIGYWGYNSLWFRQTFGSLAAVITLSVLMIVMACFIGCCMQAFRACALPIFIIFTLVVSLLVAVCITAYQSSTVLLAVGITLALVVGLTIYACVTKTDFTTCGPYLMMILMVLIIFGIVTIFWRNPIVQLIYACLGALLFSIYLIYDTQLVIGKGTFSYSLDDAYLAAIQLYLDVINLFLFILQILGGGGN